MQNHELIGLTLDKLLTHFRDSPESFEFSDGNTMSHTLPTIMFRPKVQLSDHSGTLVNDPNNEHAVLVCWNESINTLSCYIFAKAPSTLNTISADINITSGRWFEKWRQNYKKFMLLKELIAERDAYKHNMNYLKKLSSVFPDTLDDKLF
jgi:hypothetical protein